MYCSHCGSKIETNAHFCKSCGTKIGSKSDDLTKKAIQFDAATVIYAGFWKRAAALFIDNIILYLLLFIIGFIWGFMLALLFNATADFITSSAYIVGIFGCWLYFALFESSVYQATPGKMVLGIMVTDLNANRISFGKASLRYVCKIVSLLTLGIGYIMAGFTEKKQALHDIMAGSLVVNKKSIHQ
jgi:uncharacterized RDD family membrane protein YckC